MTWEIAGPISTKELFILEIQIPSGFEPEGKVGQKEFNTEKRLYTETITSENTKGNLLLITSQPAGDAVFSAMLYRAGEVLATTTYILPRHETFEMTSAGGIVTALQGKVKVTFPAGAIGEDVVLNAGFPEDEHLPDGYSPKVFELKARSKGNSENDVSRFQMPLTIEVDYSDLELTSEQEDELHLYWYNEKTEDWHALESYRDKETKTLRATTDHFTVFDIGVNNWRATRLPTIDAFQVAKFTGAATFNLPIEVPAGPGGFQPNINLSYNSQVVDQATTKTQASWVGMGWSMDGGGGSIVETDTGKFMLNTNGISARLIQEAAGGSYYTMEKNFWKITRVDDAYAEPVSWQVFDTQGNIYLFETKAVYAHFDPGLGAYRGKPYAWHLTSVTNAHGQVMTYNYYRQSNLNVGNTRTDTAVYLSSIYYAGSRVRVRFMRQSRGDYTIAYDTDAAVHMYEKDRLDYILIEKDGDGDGNFEQQVHTYDFTYIGEAGGGVTNDRIWPFVNYSAGASPLTLRSVQEFGWNGSAWEELPPHTFTYDNLHLTMATNGYGGEVEFVYETQPWYDETNVPTDYIRTHANCLAWVNYGSTFSCNSGTNEMTVTGGAPSGGVGKSFLVDASSSILRPGGVYKVTFSGSKTQGSVIKVGMLYRPAVEFKQVGESNQFSAIINPLNDNAHSAARIYFEAIGTTSTGKFTSVEVKLLPSFYRVLQKKVKAVPEPETEQTYITAYSYTNPWMIHNEFRGHEYVTETAPDGTKTKTQFYQDAGRNGRTLSVETSGPNNILSSRVVMNYQATSLPEYPASGNYYHAWVHLDSEARYIYDLAGNPAGGTKTVYAYDSGYGNLITKMEYGNPEGTGSPYRTTTTTYGPTDNASTYIVSVPNSVLVTDSAGAWLAYTRYYFNNATCHYCAITANILTMTRVRVNDNYAQTNYEYDAWGNQTGVTTYSGYGGANSNPTSGAQTTATEYDANYHTYPVAVTNPLGHETEFEYNYAIGVPTSMTDPNGNTVTAEYDAFGRMISLTRPGEAGESLTMNYSDAYPFTSTVTLKVDEVNDYSITRVYDGLGRETHVNSGGVSSETVYASPTETRQYLPNDPVNYTATVYNSNSQTTTVTMPDGTHSTTTTNGLTTIVTDAKGYQTVSTMDVWGRVTNVTPHTGPGIVYTYDAAGNPTTITRGGATTSIEYNIGGSKKNMNDPDMGYWQYTYDAIGNMLAQTDARGCTLTLGYDPLNRLTNKNSSGNCGTQVNTSYTYDVGVNGIGHRTSMTSGTINNSWTYDDRGRLKTETTMGYTTTYNYNSADLMTSMVYPDGETVNYTYDSKMLLNSVIGASNYVTSTTYDPTGRIDIRTLGNGLTQDFNYYNWNTQGGRLQSLVTGSLQNMTYQYDNAGNITNIADSVASETSVYSYDELHRLTSWNLNGVIENYTYNSSTGNLETKAGITLSYNDASHKHAATSTGSNTYSYDQNGNQTTRVIGADTFTLLYDAENRVVEVKKNSAMIAQFTYDGDGRRVKSVMGSETILFVGTHYEVMGSEITKYYFAGTSRIAMRQGSTLSYLLGDHLDSTNVTTDSNGALVSELRYKPWGETRYTFGTTPTNYKYTGQREESSFGLYFYQSRFYDTSLGRFTQPDTIIPQNQGVQAWDRFAYVNNNPIRYSDPTGHCILLCGRLYDLYLHFYGLIPDNEGINYAISNVDKNNSLVAAGLAVQSQWYNYFWDNQYNPFASSYGPAQATKDELNGKNPHNPEVAVDVIQTRIDTVLNECTTCIERDKVILAALAQNGSDYALDALNNVSNYYDLLPDGGYDWESYFNNLNETGGFYDRRAEGHHNFSSRFQLHLFMNNLEELGEMGFELPILRSTDWDYIENLQWGNVPVHGQGVGGTIAW